MRESGSTARKESIPTLIGRARRLLLLHDDGSGRELGFRLDRLRLTMMAGKAELEANTRCGKPMDEVDDPIEFFRCWMKDAEHSELNDPNAMSLATATEAGLPSVRIVLMKRLDERGFTFYTNGESRKGGELRANAHAALCFHWKSRKRQVRVEGTIVELSADDADAYFKRRARMSQIGAWASDQSRPLTSRAELLARTSEVEARFPEPQEVPRPPHWVGFAVEPKTIEFWQEADFRLHDRVLFTANGAAWTRQRLFP